MPDLGRFPWRRKWQPTPVFLPGKSHGQRNQVGYSPRGHKSVGCDLATNSNSNNLHGFSMITGGLTSGRGRQEGHGQGDRM